MTQKGGAELEAVLGQIPAEIEPEDQENINIGTKIYNLRSSGEGRVTTIIKNIETINIDISSLNEIHKRQLNQGIQRKYRVPFSLEYFNTLETANSVYSLNIFDKTSITNKSYVTGPVGLQAYLNDLLRILFIIKT